MTITALARADIAAVAALMSASPLLRRYGVSARSARSSVADGLAANDILLVARERGEVVAFAWVITMSALDHSAYLRLLLVAESRRSAGIGAGLLTAVERLARRQQARHLVLLVTKTNRRARSFYERHGYRHVGDLPHFVRPTIDEALYAKDLRG
jgi:ribosomal protein S18 acetylase RimI-like enzyme